MQYICPETFFNVPNGYGLQALYCITLLHVQVFLLNACFSSNGDFQFLFPPIKLLHFFRCLEKQNNNSKAQLFRAHRCSVLSACTYGPDHPPSQEKSHLRGHREEVHQSSRRIIGTISICTTSCQICCWCSANHFRCGHVAPALNFTSCSTRSFIGNDVVALRDVPVPRASDGVKRWLVSLWLVWSSSDVPWTVVAVSLGRNQRLSSLFPR